METTFTGIRNLSYLKTNIPHDISKPKNKYLPIERHILNMQLTDDVNGNDLSQFKSLLGKTDILYRPHPVNPDFLNLEIFTNSNLSESGRIIFLNRVGINITDSKLPMMSFLAKLLKRISNMKDMDFSVDNRYTQPNVLRRSTFCGEDILEVLSDKIPYTEKLNIIARIHSPEFISKNTAEMFKCFEDEMLYYLA